MQLHDFAANATITVSNQGVHRRAPTEADPSGNGDVVSGPTHSVGIEIVQRIERTLVR